MGSFLSSVLPPEPSPSQSLNRGSKPGQRQSDRPKSRQGGRRSERYRLEILDTRPDIDMEPQMETGSHLPERIDPLTPGQEGLPAGSNIDTDIKMEDVSDAGATRPPAPPSRYECEGARLDGNCKHLEDLKRHIENGQVLQLQLDRVREKCSEECNEECNAIRREINQLGAERNEFRRKWKQAAKELGRLTRTPQSASQVTDSDLDKWASQLRTAIRDFAIRYFESDSPFLNFQERFKMAQRAAGFELMAETTVGTVDFRSFLSSPTRCSAVIQACIWAFLDREVFSKFCWAGELSDDVVRIYEKLWNAAEDVEGDRKVKAWVVSTTKLFVDLDGIEGEKEAMKEERNATIQNLVENILKIIEPFAKVDHRADSYEHFLREMEDILERAIAMDRDICGQAADVTWSFGPDVPYQFDAATMAVERGEMLPSANSTVIMVIAPAMYKKGRSNGDDFKKPRQLILPIEVTCRPVEDA